jgi:rieske iron-sulfur protein
MDAARRTVLKAAVGLGLADALARPAAAQDGDPRKARPQPGDRFVFAAGDRKGQTIMARDLPAGTGPVTAWPMDPRTKVVRDDSRLNEVMLLRLDPGELAAETRARAAEGVVAYSAVCTHTGCDVWEWHPSTRTVECPCHYSVFDPKDGARVLDGPAPRRLPALPLKVDGGVLTAAGAFVGRPGFQPSG